MKTGLALALICATLACASADGPETAFSYLDTGPAYIQSTNGLDVRVEAEGMRLVSPTDRVDEFNGHPYEISLGALVSGDVAVLVHAERVADASGASDYSDLPVAEWPGASFRTRQFCVVLAPEDLEGEHDLEWLRDQGFDPAGSLLLDQAFLTSADHNNEVVVSIAIRGVDCANNEAIRAALAAARARVRVSS